MSAWDGSFDGPARGLARGSTSLAEWQSRQLNGTLNSYLNALDQHPQSADIQMMQQQTQLQNTLAQYQNSLGGFANNCIGILQASAATPAKQYSESRRTDLAEDGDKIIERIAFWNELPVVGAIVTSRLAARLDRISDRIEELA